jgi:hypothetical protein
MTLTSTASGSMVSMIKRSTQTPSFVTKKISAMKHIGTLVKKIQAINHNPWKFAVA